MTILLLLGFYLIQFQVPQDEAPSLIDHDAVDMQCQVVTTRLIKTYRADTTRDT